MIHIFVFQIAAGPEYGVATKDRESATAELAARLILAGGVPFRYLREYTPDQRG